MNVIDFPLDRIVRMPAELPGTTEVYLSEREKFPELSDGAIWADIREFEEAYRPFLNRDYARWVGVGPTPEPEPTRPQKKKKRRLDKAKRSQHSTLAADCTA